uniref:Uncharacterized protein n=1 Tax=Quercus lobata TaxID=97700 RepID=A0A7N2R582_QUELO
MKERLGLSAVIMGSRRFGAVRRGNDDGRLGSVSDSVCPVVVVRYPEDKDAVAEAVLAVKEGEEDDEAVIKTVPIEVVHEKEEAGLNCIFFDFDSGIQILLYSKTGFSYRLFVFVDG